ncbi:MAG: SOS response-associated peptidase family protein [Erythrobacter sp.]
MCNLYRMTKGKDEVASWFDAVDRMSGANFGSEVYPGYLGAVVAEGAVRSMNWGFPLVMKGKRGQPLKPKPVNNARTDKLDSFFWRESFAERRCLIPMTGWAEAQGAKGAMTRTWMSLPDVPLFAAAGVWRISDEWGACFSMVMTDSSGSQSAEIHARMPVILAPGDYEAWVAGDPNNAINLCQAFTGQLNVDRTDEGWTRTVKVDGGKEQGQDPDAAQPSLF